MEVPGANRQRSRQTRAGPVLSARFRLERAGAGTNGQVPVLTARVPVESAGARLDRRVRCLYAGGGDGNGGWRVGVAECRFGITERMLIDPYSGGQLHVEPIDRWVYNATEPYMLAKQKKPVSVFWWPFSEKRQYAVYSNTCIKELVSDRWVEH